MRKPINPIAHAFLTDQGAAVLDHQGDADFDDGDPENGPGTWGYPDYDCYLSDGVSIAIDWRGMFTSEFDPRYEAYDNEGPLQDEESLDYFNRYIAGDR